MPDSVIGHVNVTPLIDVVMVLIVFFMLVARIGVSTGAEPMRLPQSVRGAKLEDMGNTLTLNLQPAPAGPTVTTLINGRREELNVLPSAKPPLLVDTLTFLRKDNPGLKIILRADKDLPYDLLQPVLKACADANVKNVNFTTEKVAE
jgi:biopolymer transport protein ExbD